MRLRACSLLLAVALAAAACTDGDTSPPDDPDERSDERTDGGGEALDVDLDDGDADEVLMEVRTGGGYVPELTGASEFPSFVLYGDGTVVQPVDEADEVEDPPLLPTLESRRLTSDGVEAVVEAALDAGVDSENDFGDPDITDLPTTVVEIDVGEVDEEVAVYALSETIGLSDAEEEAREDLSDFLDDLTDLEELVGDEASDAEPYSPDAWLVFSEVTDESPESGPGEADALLLEPWPLDADQAAEPRGGVRCAEVRGDEDVAAFEEALEGVFEGTQFEVSPPTVDVSYRVQTTVRPTLEHGDGCDEAD